MAGVDFAPGSAAVVAEAAVLARALGCGLHLIHVAAPEPDFVGYDRPGGPYDRDRRAGELAVEHEQLRDLAASVEDPQLEVTPLVVIGPTVETLLAEADRFDAALVVVGSHGHRPLHRLLVGSTTDGLLRASSRPVVIVPVPRETA